MTVAIPSYQRAGALARLLGSIADELERSPEQAEGLEVVVVLDGSTDGSQRMLETMSLAAPLRHAWQPNRGMAAARNAALGLARHEIVWFLDDDMIVDPGTLARHRAAHQRGADDHVLMGPCWFPPDRRVVAPVREWSHIMYAELGRTGVMTSAEYFSPATTSAPVHVLLDVGAFDESFEFWGGEDMELGIRLLDARIPVRYDAAASVQHHQADRIRDVCRKKYTEARCAVRLVRRYPHTFAALFPPADAMPGVVRLVRWLPRWPWPVRLAAATAAFVAEAVDRPRGAEPGRSAAFRIAIRLARLAGILAEDADGSFRRRLLASAG